MIVMDLSKQQALNADPRAIQQITANLDRPGLRLFTRSCKSIVNVLYSNFILSNIIV